MLFYINKVYLIYYVFITFLLTIFSRISDPPSAYPFLLKVYCLEFCLYMVNSI